MKKIKENDCNCERDGCGSESCGTSACPSASCGNQPKSFIEKTHQLNTVRRVIGVVSGKGGVANLS